MNPIARIVSLAAVAVLSLATAQRADDLDTFIKAQMSQRQVNGLSLAIVQDGRIEARAYGVTSRGGTPVTEATLFQAGSISKPVAAMGALRLVEQGTLSLDEDVNTRLKSWKVPENEYTATEKVTLRRLVSHTAGLTVHGFPGYDIKVPMPTTVQVLDGAGNTAPVRVNVVPGSIWRYSGGGYTVMQLLVSDVTGKPFAQVHERGRARTSGNEPQHLRTATASRARGTDGVGVLSRPVRGFRTVACLSRDGGSRSLDHADRPGAVCDGSPALARR